MCRQISNEIFECNGVCGAAGSVWGSDTYTGDSNIYVAAKHCGLVPGRFIKITKGQQASFASSTRNGVTTNSYGSYGTSFSLAQEGNYPNLAFIAIESFKDVFLQELEKLKQAVSLISDDSNKMCIVCHSKVRTHLCMPCNHFRYCQECIKAVLARGTCTSCNQPVTGYMNAFL